jgi:uncharacterized membrane protein (DUF4010 family)
MGAATAVGLLIGIERGWKLRSVAPGERVAGVRTFTLLGILGGLAGLIGAEGRNAVVSGALLAGAVSVLAIGYFHKAVGDGRPDATTPIAALITLALAFFAARSPALSIAGASLVTLVLALRRETHRFVARMEAEDVKALARFAVIAGAILPFLPDGDYGPYGALNPQKLWLVVVLVTGFSFIGYVANRIFGTRHGTIATALIGGAYSSTAVTQSLSQRLGTADGGSAETAGIALASAVMYLRVLLVVAVLATSVVGPFARIIAPPLLVAAAAGLWLMRKATDSKDAAPPGNPIAMLPALGFLLFVALAAIAARWAEGRFGQQGIATLILIMGSLDVDAAVVTIGGLKPGAISTDLAAAALGGTVLINMTVKLGVTLINARAKGKGAALALAASMVALALSLLVAVNRL